MKHAVKGRFQPCGALIIRRPRSARAAASCEFDVLRIAEDASSRPRLIAVLGEALKVFRSVLAGGRALW